MGALAAAASMGAFANLQTLHLSRSWIGGTAIKAFLAAPSGGALSQLRELNLNFNQIGDSGLQAIAQTASAQGPLADLQVLSVMNNGVKNAGLAAFAKSVAAWSLRSLTTLFLTNNLIGNMGVWALGRAATRDPGAREPEETLPQL